MVNEFKNSLSLLTQKICRDLKGQEIPKEHVWTVVNEPNSPPRVALDVDRPALSNLRASINIGLLGLSEYRAVSDAAENDSKLKDGIVVDAGGTLRPTEPTNLTRSLVTNFLWRYLRGGNQLDWDESRFDETYDELKHQLHNKSVVFHTTIPLSNLKIDVDEIQFGDEFKLTPASTDELERWINQDRFLAPLGAGLPQWDSDYVERPAVLHARHTAVGRPPSKDPQKNSRRLPRINVGDALLALRLVMNAPISVIFQEQETEGMMGFGGGGTIVGSRTHSPLRPLAIINEEKATQIKKVWLLLHESPNVQLLSLPLRRWQSSLGRPNLEDTLIDAWISLEALLLGGMEGELSYRAAMRLAEFLGTNGEDRKAIYDGTRVSYTWRSIIVHGSKNGRFTKRNPLAESVRLTSEYLRAALLKVLELPNRFDPNRLESDLLKREADSA